MMNLVPISALLGEAERISSPEYRAGYDRIFGKKLKAKKPVLKKIKKVVAPVAMKKPKKLAEPAAPEKPKKVAEPAVPEKPKKVVEPAATKKPPVPKTPKAEMAKGVKQQQSRQKATKTREMKAREKEKTGLAQARADRLARRDKVKQDIAKKTGTAKPPGLNTIPAQIAHCMMAVHVKRRKSRVAAWNICRWAMTKHGYLDGPYRVNTKLPKAVKQTGKGSRRSFQHGMEKAPLNGGVPGNGGSKFAKFVTMFKTAEPQFLKKA